MGRKPTVKVVEVIVKRRIRLERKTCQQCGKEFMRTKLAQYCSKACVRMASYWRNPERYRQKRLESYRRHKERLAKKTSPTRTGRFLSKALSVTRN